MEFIFPIKVVITVEFTSCMSQQCTVSATFFYEPFLYTSQRFRYSSKPIGTVDNPQRSLREQSATDNIALLA